MCNKKRWYDRNFSISCREGVLENRMKAFKFDGARGWGLIFARVLLGFLSEHRFRFDSYELIVANPTYVERTQGIPQNGAAFVIATAAQLDTAGWPFDTGTPRAVIKTSDTAKMKSTRSWKQREAIAETELREALVVPDPTRIRNKRIVVFDDLYTTGHTLNEVARRLIRDGGAVGVTGISLARQVWKSN